MEFGSFLVLGLFFHPSLPIIGHHHPVKNYFSKQVLKRLSSKKFPLDKLTIAISISNCKKAVFNYLLCKKSWKALGNWMATMVTKQKIFDQLYHLWVTQGYTYFYTKISSSWLKAVMSYLGGPTSVSDVGTKILFRSV